MFQIPDSIPLKFINSTGKYYEVFSPNDGSFVTRVQEATEADIHQLLKETKSIQKKIRALRPYERSAILKKVAEDLKGKQDFLARVIATEGGKPWRDAKAEVTRAIATLELCAEETMRLEGEVVPMERTAAGKDHISFTMRDPIGPVLAISAFNHPLNLVAHQVGTAIASGCSVVLKPAPATPISSFLLTEAFHNAGLPEHGVRLVLAEVPLIQQLVGSSEFGFLSFIGSAKVGWELRKNLAPGTRLALEHGGQAPAIIREDADIEAAVPSLIKGAYYHAGQVCISTQRIFVHEKIIDTFMDKFTRAAEKLIVGSALNEDTDVGPMIRPGEVVRLQKWIQESLDKGAKLVLGNKVSGNNKQFLSPTILTNVPRECSIMKDEAFGPVVCINKYTDENELMDYINSNDYIFEASLFTKDISKAMRIATEISTMTFVINNHSAFRVDQMPFGGHKKSGLGMGGVKYAMEELTRTKQIIIKM